VTSSGLNSEPSGEGAGVSQGGNEPLSRHLHPCRSQIRNGFTPFQECTTTRPRSSRISSYPSCSFNDLPIPRTPSTARIIVKRKHAILPPDAAYSAIRGSFFATDPAGCSLERFGIRSLSQLQFSLSTNTECPLRRTHSLRCKKPVGTRSLRKTLANSWL